MGFNQRFYQHTHNSSNAKAPFCLFNCLVFITQYFSAKAKSTKEFYIEKLFFRRNYLSYFSHFRTSLNEFLFKILWKKTER